jgi:branched-chain amino acid transport system substrate-binding protein
VLKRTMTGLVLVASAALAVSCSSSSGDSASGGGGGGTVVFGSEVPLTGAAASVGVPQENGIKLAVQQINAAGGLKVGGSSYQIKLNEQDDASTGTTGVQVVQKLLQSDIHFLFGGTSSAVVGAYIPIIQNRTDLINVISGSVLPGITKYKPVYRYQVEVQRNEIAATNVAKAKGYKSVAFVTDKNHSGYVGNTDNAVQQMESVGAAVTTKQEYTAGDTQFGSQINAILRDRPDAIYLRGFAADLLRFITQVRQLGYTGPILSNAGYTAKEVADENAAAGMTNVFDVLPPQVANIATSTTSDPAIVAEAKKFVTDYKTAFNGDPGLLSGQGYDSIWVAAAAIEKAGTTTDIPKIQAALDALTVGDVQHVVLPMGATGDKVFVDHQASFAETLIIWTDGKPTVGPDYDGAKVG